MINNEKLEEIYKHSDTGYPGYIVLSFPATSCRKEATLTLEDLRELIKFKLESEVEK